MGSELMSAPNELSIFRARRETPDLLAFQHQNARAHISIVL